MRFSGFIKFWSSKRKTENTMSHLYFKDTHREKVPLNKTPALRRSTTMGI